MKRPATDSQPLTIALCAGEASGDLLGAHLMNAIRAQYPHVNFIGIGGPRMLAAGINSLYDQEKLAVRGFVEVMRKLPEILTIRRGLITALKQIRPHVFVGIDAPDFNLGVAMKLKRAGIATVHYVSPSVWAWRRKRVKKIVKQVDEVLCLFPMEPELYQQAGGHARFIGHPLAQILPMHVDKVARRIQLKLPPLDPVFVLMPGSRVSEIDFMAQLFLQTAEIILQRYPKAQFLLPLATAATRQRMLQILAQPAWKKLPVRIMNAHADMACQAADVTLVASGTATLEVALCRCPMVISYKISSLTYAYVKHKIKVPYVGLPNILLGKSIVPELLQHQATPQKLAEAVLHWYESPAEVRNLQNNFQQLYQQLSLPTDELAAQAVLQHALGTK
ncbi:MAG: lipid-A-disaccharide synthase [Snodgrassella sp.]|nr:lipid-A-disaccharide synthase [Snodgrassella sp.]